MFGGKREGVGEREEVSVWLGVVLQVVAELLSRHVRTAMNALQLPNSRRCKSCITRCPRVCHSSALCRFLRLHSLHLLRCESSSKAIFWLSFLFVLLPSNSDTHTIHSSLCPPFHLDPISTLLSINTPLSPVSYLYTRRHDIQLGLLSQTLA